MNILKIQQYDINNGPGVRASIWTAGCKHKCKGCWASDTWNKDKGTPLEECIEDIEEVLKNKNIDGVSILGGDPFYEFMELGKSKDLEKLLNLCLYYNKSIWLWTGYNYEELPIKLTSKCDVIIDGLFIERLKDKRLKYKGSSNQRLIKIKRD